MLEPRKIRDLTKANPPQDEDVIPISQMTPSGARTNQISYSELVARVISEVEKARMDLVEEFRIRDNMLEDEQERLTSTISKTSAHTDMIETMVSNLSKKRELPLVGTVTATQTATVAITLGPRVLTIPLAGTQPGQFYLPVPQSVPAGYFVANAFCQTAGQISIVVHAPALAIGATYSFPVRILRLDA